MKKTCLLTFSLALLLTMIGCQKADHTLDETNGGDSRLSKAAKNRGSNMEVQTVCDIIDFENTGNFTYLERDGAQFLTAVTSVGGSGPIKVYSYSPNKPEWGGPKSPAAVIFNSTNPHWEDPDLGTPNGIAVSGGKGVGTGGASGPYINNVSLGNIVVIQEFNPRYYPAPNDGDIDDNTLEFDFTNVGPVTATALTVIDVEFDQKEGGSVKLYDKKGGTLLHTASFLNTGANGVGKINLNNTTGVGCVLIEIDGSLGIDNFEFCRQVGTSCTYTQGFWKNHVETWPVSSLTLGSGPDAKSYTKEELLRIFNTPVKGNGLVSLAHQLIAAKLNLAKGANGSVINATITAADEMIGNRVIPPIGMGALSTAQTSYLTDKLASYNEGLIGPGHCD